MYNFLHLSGCPNRKQQETTTTRLAGSQNHGDKLLQVKTKVFIKGSVSERLVKGGEDASTQALLQPIGSSDLWTCRSGIYKHVVSLRINKADHLWGLQSAASTLRRRLSTAWISSQWQFRVAMLPCLLPPNIPTFSCRSGEIQNWGAPALDYSLNTGCISVCQRGVTSAVTSLVLRGELNQISCN